MELMEVRRRVMSAMASGGLLSGYKTMVVTVDTAIQNGQQLLDLVQALPANDFAFGVHDRDWSITPKQSELLWFAWWGSVNNSIYGRWRGTINPQPNWAAAYDCIVPAGSKIIVTYKPATT